MKNVLKERKRKGMLQNKLGRTERLSGFAEGCALGEEPPAVLVFLHFFPNLHNLLFPHHAPQRPSY